MQIVQKQRYRALLDTGAAVSVISAKVYKNLKSKPKLEKLNIPVLQAAKTREKEKRNFGKPKLS